MIELNITSNAGVNFPIYVGQNLIQTSLELYNRVQQTNLTSDLTSPGQGGVCDSAHNFRIFGSVVHDNNLLYIIQILQLLYVVMLGLHHIGWIIPISKHL